MGCHEGGNCSKHSQKGKPPNQADCFTVPYREHHCGCQKIKLHVASQIPGDIDALQRKNKEEAIKVVSQKRPFLYAIEISLHTLPFPHISK